MGSDDSGDEEDAVDFQAQVRRRAARAPVTCGVTCPGSELSGRFRKLKGCRPIRHARGPFN